MKFKIFLILFFLLNVAHFSQAQTIDETIIQPKNVEKHIAYLASDKLEGRGTGTRGEMKAAKYIAKAYKKLGLKPIDAQTGYLQIFNFKKSNNPHGGEASAEAQNIEARNVVGFLDNGAVNTIVIGAHYDHLGLGHDHNSLDANPEGQIHNGADDNASGTAGVIELARYFTSNKRTEPFNFLFICFSGEELGLIGSKKFCEKPTIDLKTVNYMVNMDMIGRYNTEKGLMVQGIGTSPLWGKMLDYLPTDLKIKTDSSGVGPSDYTSFYLQKLPVLGFFTGGHSDYHKPTDDLEKVEIAGEVRVLNYIARLIEATCTFPKMEFSETRQPEKTAKAFKVTMGVLPDYAFDKKGMRLDGVTDGKPAAAAGMKAGDIILKIGTFDIENVYSYMEALSKHNKGETVKVAVQRADKMLELELTF
jgi:Zn-dependent M28 family amino/carboxypeptidase